MDNSKNITHISLCAGYGGIDLGLKRAIPNLLTVAFSEIEGFACANLVSKMEAGFLDSAPIWTDLKTFPWESFRDRVDILSGGFPCQPFSSAGKRAGDEDPRHLFPYILDGIGMCRPSVVFLENVEGILSAKLAGDNWRDPAGTPVLLHVLRELERVGYKVSWGIFSASEVGAPHQRKRVFILAIGLADSIKPRLERFCRDVPNGSEPGRIGEEKNGSVGESGVRPWPSRPGERQYPWEPPRVVGNTKSRKDIGRKPGDLGLEASEGGCCNDATDSTGESLVDAEGERTNGRWKLCSEDGRSHGSLFRESEPTSSETGNMEHPSSEGSQGESCRELRQPEQEQESERSDGEGSDQREAESGLGLLPYGTAGELDAPELTYESDTRNAYEVLLALWDSVNAQEIQWTAGGSISVLAQTVLQSGVQLSAFPQRICFFIWCIQTGHEIKGFGLPEMWISETAWNSPQGQEPTQQFIRELAYALCILSYRLALERGETPAQGAATMQGVCISGAAKWVLSETLVSLQEVWRSELNEEAWTIGAYSEAANLGSNRTDELRLLGNGVVPATAELAWRTLFKELNKK